MQPNSGATRRRGKQGDIRQNGFLLDTKDAIGQKTFTLSKPDFEKLARQAASTPPGLLPAQIIMFEGLRLRVMRDEDYLAEKVANAE